MTFNDKASTRDRLPPPYTNLEEAVAVARGLIPRLRERVPLAEQLRRLPDETIADLVETRLLDIATPRRWGGAELNTDAVFEVTTALAEGCGSTGWVYALWMMHVWHIGQWGETVQEQILNHPRPLVSSIVNTTGEVRHSDGGYILSAYGPYSSGVDHCEWLEVRIEAELEPGAHRETCWFLVPKAEVTVEHDWDTVGLRGTGSHTARVTEAFVPRERAMRTADVAAGRVGAALHGSPMFCAAADFTTLLPTCGPVMGIARSMCRAFEELSKKKAAEGVPLHLQMNGLMRLAEATADVDAAHALIAEDARQFCYVPEAEITPFERAKAARDTAYAGQLCRRAIEKLFDASGSKSIYLDQEFSRLWRDGNAAATHFRLNWDYAGVHYGTTAAGIPVKVAHSNSRSFIAANLPPQTSN